VPYSETTDVPNVVVDGSANDSTVLTLSHWPGSPTPASARDDLSAQISFHALDQPSLFEGVDVVTNNHFDQDGLCAAFALVHPDQARSRRDLVIDVASAGDFGTFRSRDAARLAFAIAALEDEGRSPLPAGTLSGSYDEVCGRLYAEMLPRFTEMLDHPHRHRELWDAEDAHLGDSIAAIERGTVRIEEHAATDLAVVTVPEQWAMQATSRFTMTWSEAVHPLAINNATTCLRVLLVHGRRYRLELRYESWVMLSSRSVLPRPDLRVLASRLAALEPEGATWKADPPGSLTPHLQPVDAESGIDPLVLVAEVQRFLAEAPPAWDPFAPR
jgi:hypothetical protein